MIKFGLTTSTGFYDEEQAKELEKLGFCFVDSKSSNYDYPTHKVVINYPTVEFETLEQLVEFSKEWGKIILHWYEDGDGNIVPELEIYDGHRE